MKAFGITFFLLALVFVLYGALDMSFAPIFIAVIFTLVGIVLFGLADRKREPVKTTAPVAAKKAPAVPVEYEFVSQFTLDEATGEVIERQVKRRKMPEFK